MFVQLRAGWALTQPLRLRHLLLRRASVAAGDPSSSLIPKKSDDNLPEQAPAASKKENFQSSEKADAVLQLLRSRGFSEAQVTECVGKQPKLLLLDADKLLKPNLEALEATGFSNAGMVEMLCKDPTILRKNNEVFGKVIAVLRTLVPKEADFVNVITRYPWILGSITLSRISPNVDVLLKEGVPMKNVSAAFLGRPRMFLNETHRLVELVQIIKEMGFRPSAGPFMLAVQIMTVQKKWDLNLKAYKSFGLTDDQILSAFRIQPSILLMKEEKIRKMMGYFVDDKGIAPASVLKCPVILTLSLEKRIIPRYRVLEMLVERGILTRWNRSYVFRLTDKEFLEKYVVRHEAKIPELVNLYPANENQ